VSGGLSGWVRRQFSENFLDLLLNFPKFTDVELFSPAARHASCASRPARVQQMEGPSSRGPSAPAGAQQVRDFFEAYGEANRYTIHEVIGKGSYGIVCSATDNQTKEKVRVLDIHRRSWLSNGPTCPLAALGDVPAAAAFRAQNAYGVPLAGCLPHPTRTNAQTRASSVVCKAAFPVPPRNTIGDREFQHVLQVAIKRVTNVFKHVSDATRILREMMLLRHLKHADIVEIKHVMLPPSPTEFNDIYIVFELMDSDLHQVTRFLCTATALLELHTRHSRAWLSPDPQVKEFKACRTTPAALVTSSLGTPSGR
jgi:hypothetical protein